MIVATTKTVMALFNCKEFTAKKKMKEVRIALNKKVNNNGTKGADYLTMEQIIEHFKLK